MTQPSGARVTIVKQKRAVVLRLLADDVSRSSRLGSRAKKLPHLPERWVRLVQFRMLQVNLNIIERGFTSSDLGNLIPTIVLLPPAIQVPEPDIAMVNEC